MRTRGFILCRIVSVLLLILLPSTAAAGDCELTLDLSEGDLGIDGSTRGAISCVKLINAIPDASYEVDLRSKDCIAPFDSSVLGYGGQNFGGLKSGVFAGLTSESDPKKKDDPCVKATKTLGEALGKARSEKAVKEAVDIYRKGKPVACNKGKDLVASTVKQEKSTLVVGDDLTLAVTVRRLAEDGFQARKWENAPSCRGWQSTYGFTFVPNRDRKFFSESKDDGTFTVAEQTDREEGDFLASVLFQYYSPEKKWAPTFGLGYDLEEISVLAGIGWIYKRNVTLTAGVAIHERTDLVGRYKVGDPLKESIDAAQLVEKTFVPNLYLGVAFRFGSNIWAQRDTARAKVEKARADQLKAQKEEAEKKTQEAEKKVEEAKKKEEAAALRAAEKEKCEKAANVALIEAQNTCAENKETAAEKCAAESDKSTRATCEKNAGAAEARCLKLAEAKKDEAVEQCNVVSLQPKSDD